MSFSDRDWERLGEVYELKRRHFDALAGKLKACGKVPDAIPLAGEAAGCRQFIASVDFAAFAAWLGERIANPIAEGYILSLWRDGVVKHNRRQIELWPQVEEGSAEALSLYAEALREELSLLRKLRREVKARLRPRLRLERLGFGEISQVLSIEGSPLDVWTHPETGEPVRMVFKKMLPFPSREAAENHARWYMEYNRILRDEIGICVPPYDARIVGRGPGPVLGYMLQGRVNPAWVCGNEFLARLNHRAAARLYWMVLREYEKVYHFNRIHQEAGIQVGLDGQIPNWAVRDFSGEPESLTGNETLIYLDTNVPMVRINGRDVVSTDIYFQTLPGFARWLIKRLNLDQEVMDRYFNFRTIILDFVSNFIVRHRPDLVPLLVEISNEAFKSLFADAGWEPLTVEEVNRYYREDVFIWRLWRSLKLMGALSDGVASGKWQVLKRIPEFYHIWTKPIF